MDWRHVQGELSFLLLAPEKLGISTGLMGHIGQSTPSTTLLSTKGLQVGDNAFACVCLSIPLSVRSVIMPPPNGLEACMFSPCVPVRPSVCPSGFLYAAITDELLMGIT